MLVVLQEKLGKRRRGTKEEGVQTRAARKLPRTLSFAAQVMEDLHDRGAQTEEEQDEQTKRQNLRNDWPGFGAGYEKTLRYRCLFIAGEQFGFGNLVR